MGFDMVRLDQLATFEMGQSPDSKFVIESDEGIPFLQGCAEFGAITPNFAVSCTRPKKTCQPGDILISIRAPVGDLNKADREYCIGRGLAAVRFNDGIASNFGWHLLKFWSSSLRIVAQGSTFEAIGRYELTNLQVCYVHLSEQRRIAEILDTVDEAIQKTEALISKLKAIKQGLLHDLLTYGLDKNGKLRDPKAHPEQFKDSPLGRIPKEWVIHSLEDFSKYISYGFTNPMPSTVEGPWMITAFDIGDGRIKYEQARHTSIYAFHHQLTQKSKPCKGDILITKDGTLGRVAIVDSKYLCINQSVACIQPLPNTDIFFLFHYLQSPNTQKRMLADAGGSTIKHIYVSKLRNLEVVYPKKKEREKIVEIIKSHDSRIRTEEQHRDKLKLQKKGLMHDLLTGKVRVEM